MMRWRDGFDHWIGTVTGTSTFTGVMKYDGYIANAAYSNNYTYVGPTYGRPSASDSLTGGCYQNPGAGGSATYLLKNLGVNCTTLYAGVAFKWADSYTNSSSMDIPIVSFGDIGTIQTTLYLAPSGQIYVVCNGVTVCSSVVLMVANVWSYIEIGVTFSGTATTGSVYVRLNGLSTPICSATGIRTSSTSNAYANQFYLGGYSQGGSSSCWMWYDDLYCCDSTGTYNNNFLGDIRVRTQFATANGTTNNYSATFASWAASHAYSLYTTITDGASNVWRCTTAGTSGATISWPGGPTVGQTKTDSGVTWTCVATSLAQFAAISETSPDGDSSYIYDSTVNDQQRFLFQATVGSQVFEVCTQAYVRKDDAGTRAIRSVVKSGGTVADNGTDFALSASYQFAQGSFEYDPNTSSAWSVAGVNAAELGIETSI